MREMGNENLMLAFIETFSPPEEVDMHARKSLQAKLYTYSAKDRIFLANVKYVVDGKKYDSFMDLLFETTDFNEFQIYFVKPRLNENWEYDVPTVEMNIMKEGCGKLVLACPFDPFSVKRWDTQHLESVEEEAMFRFYYLDFFYPESIRSQSLRGDMERKLPFTFDLFLFEDFLKFAKKFGVLPLLLRVCAYTKHFRFTYDIDIVNDALVANFRAGKFPVSARIFRHPRQYYFLDKILAAADIGEYPKRVLETVFETKGVTVFDIANAYGLSEKMAEGSLEVCVKYGYLEKVGKPPRITYVPRFESFGGAMEYTPPKLVPRVEAVERKEKEEILEDERICPVCHGRKSPDKIVCDRCARASEIIAEEKDAEISIIASEIFARMEETKPKTEVSIQQPEIKEIVEKEVEKNKEEKLDKEVVEKKEEPKSETPKYRLCPSCGFEATGLFCASCGYLLRDKQV